MSEEKEHKLNRLQSLLPEGLLADAAWLERQGYYSALRNRYMHSGWLEQIAHGLYRRRPAKLKPKEKDEPLRWQHVVISLQTILDRAVIVGGRTALELHGFSHYLQPSGPQEVHLYSREKLPGWLSHLNVDAKFVVHAAKLFHEEPVARGLGSLSVDLTTNEAASTDPLHGGLTSLPWGHWDWPLTLSTPERAILELLDELPRHETWHQADMFMEGLRTLSPRRLQKLLADCRSVKVKRLFFWFAERHNHSWLKHIERRNINLGAGKRMLARGGKFDPKYQITVPENLDAV